MRRDLHVAQVFLVAGVLSAASATAGEARRAMAEGFTLFAVKNYTVAADNYATAAAKAEDERLDPAAAQYNRAVALLKSGKDQEAAAIFQEALRSSDPVLREKTHFNRGNALVAAAEKMERADELGKASMLLDQAIDEYESAMRIDPNDEDPKVNHELATRKKVRSKSKLKEQDKNRDRPGRANPGTGSQRQNRGEEALVVLEAMKQHEASQRNKVKSDYGIPESVEKNW